ncbi:MULTISPECIES: hypothetical protein [unclassified Nocardiopsis]|uniref:hypothetical protein n=1 Tax=Nocardiopsis TaxID=2013 RepID=UPI00387B023A
MGTSDPRARKAAALAEERLRLARIREERERGRRDSVWQEFGVESERIPELRDAVEAVLAEAGDGESGPAQGLRGMLEGRMCPNAPRLFLELLRDLPPGAAAGHLAHLHGIGVPALRKWTRLGEMLHGRREPSTEELQGLPSLDPAFSLWRDGELLRRGKKLRSLERFLENAPLTLVDDLVDQGTAFSLSGQERSDEQENLYLSARRNPEQLTDEQVEALGWPEELWRRRLLEDPGLEVSDDAPRMVRDLSAMANGDPEALTRLTEFLDDRSRRLVGHVLEARDRPSAWPRVLFKDTDLWPVFEGLCTGRTLDAPQGAMVPFAAWRDLRAAHRELLDVRPSAYEHLKPHTSSEESWVREEAVAMEVYLDLRFSESGDSQVLHTALERLDALPERSAVTEGNIAWLRSRLAMDRNNRGPLFNPYLELGVAHGSDQHVWRDAWRGLRRRLQGRKQELSDINQARDLIRDIETTGGLENQSLYVLPVFPGRLFPRPRVARRFVAEPRPLARRSGPVPQELRERIRTDAITALLDHAVAGRTP